MTPRPPGPRAAPPAALILAALLLPVAAAAADAGPSATVQEALRACAAIAAPAERLACYDRLAGGAASAPATPAAAAAPTPYPVTQAAATPAPAAALAPAAPPTAAAASSAPLPKASFGLYPAEHPTAPAVAASIDTQVLAVGHSANGRMTVTLEGGALWELDEDDPLLKPGDSVVISRASLGSFLMRTATSRTHRVRRLH